MFKSRIALIAFIGAALAVFGNGVGVPHFKIVRTAQAQTNCIGCGIYGDYKPRSGCTTTTFAQDGVSVLGNGSGTSIATSSGIATTYCNDLIVAVINADSGGSVSSVTDAQSRLTFTKRAASDTAGGTVSDVEEWTAVLTGSPLTSDVITANITPSQGFITILVYAFSNVHTASPFDTNAALPNTQSNGTACTWTTSNANDIIYGAANGSQTTPDSGFTLLSQNPSDYAFSEYKSVSTTQSGSSATTLDNSGSWCDAIIKGP
jgi:hypothetical protein